MAGGDTSAAVGENSIQTPLRLLQDLMLIFSIVGFSGLFKKDCIDLSRKLSLLTHLFEEIREFRGNVVGASSTSNSCISDLSLSLRAAKGLLFVANNFDPNISTDGAVKKKKIVFQFQCVTWKLENALANLPYDHFEISEEVQEQVGLVRSQLKRATDRYGGPLNSMVVSTALSQLLEKDIDPQGNRVIVGSFLHVPNIGNIDDEVRKKININLSPLFGKDIDPLQQEGNFVDSHGCSETFQESGVANTSDQAADKSMNKELDDKKKKKNKKKKKKSDSLVVPEDFICPISLELMRDPVILSTGETYERSYIQKWIELGNQTCPKTTQKLKTLTLIPNNVLKSIIDEWYVKKHNNEEEEEEEEEQALLRNGKIKKSGDDDMAALIRKLLSKSIGKRRAVVSEILSLSKTNNMGSLWTSGGDR